CLRGDAACSLVWCLSRISRPDIPNVGATHQPVGRESILLIPGRRPMSHACSLWPPESGHSRVQDHQIARTAVPAAHLLLLGRLMCGGAEVDVRGVARRDNKVPHEIAEGDDALGRARVLNDEAVAVRHSDCDFLWIQSCCADLDFDRLEWEIVVTAATGE